MLTRRHLVLGLTAWPVAAMAEVPEPGLAWNRTGLPLVFPLHIRTVPGFCYWVTLVAEDGAPALAAFFEGGRLFRVLCPPGDYRIAVARGLEWQGEAELFGPATEVVRLRQALRFETKGLRTRKGWLLDLRDFNRPTVAV